MAFNKIDLLLVYLVITSLCICSIAQNQTTDEKFDLALIIPAWNTQFNDSVMNRVIASSFSKLFKIGENNVRLAVLQSNFKTTLDSILLTLTANESVFNKKIMSRLPLTPVWNEDNLIFAFRAINEQLVFPKGENRTKIVVVITSNPYFKDAGLNESQKLRENGIITYILFQPKDLNDWDNARKYAGSSQYIFNYTTTGPNDKDMTDLVTNLGKLQKAILRDISNGAIATATGITSTKKPVSSSSTIPSQISTTPLTNITQSNATTVIPTNGTSLSNSTEPSSKQKEEGFPGWAIAVIVVSIIAVIVLIAGIALYMTRANDAKRRETARNVEMRGFTSAGGEGGGDLK